MITTYEQAMAALDDPLIQAMIELTTVKVLLNSYENTLRYIKDAKDVETMAKAIVQPIAGLTADNIVTTIIGMRLDKIIAGTRRTLRRPGQGVAMSDQEKEDRQPTWGIEEMHAVSHVLAGLYGEGQKDCLTDAALFVSRLQRVGFEIVECDIRGGDRESP